MTKDNNKGAENGNCGAEVATIGVGVATIGGGVATIGGGVARKVAERSEGEAARGGVASIGGGFGCAERRERALDALAKRRAAELEGRREAEVERAFVLACQRCGLWALKLGSELVAGLPDRLVLAPGGRAVFVELKRAGGVPRRLQELRHESLRAYGFAVVVVDSLERAQEVAEAIRDDEEI